jgi:hypothetical protein
MLTEIFWEKRKIKHLADRRKFYAKTPKKTPRSARLFKHASRKNLETRRFNPLRSEARTAVKTARTAVPRMRTAPEPDATVLEALALRRLEAQVLAAAIAQAKQMMIEGQDSRTRIAVIEQARRAQQRALRALNSLVF